MKKIFVLFLAVVLLSFSAVNVCAASKDSRLQDGADLLTSSEESELLGMLDDISNEYDYDVVIITVDSVGYKSVSRYASDAYYDGNYGFGESYSGVLLLVSMEDRDWYIHFEGADILPSADSLSNSFVGYLSSGDYAEAFERFAETVESNVISSGWDVDNEEDFEGTVNEKESFPLFKRLFFWLIVGFIIAFIITSSMKKKLKSVETRDNAREYVRKNSFKLTRERDVFLYSNVTRIAKPKNNGNSGGRSRSSGRSSRGGGGKF